MPYKTWVVGEEVLAADFNAMVQQQTVPTFANAAARTAALTTPPKGIITYLSDVNRYESWNGTAWVAVIGGGVPIGGGQTALFGTYSGQPVQMRGWCQVMGLAGDGQFSSALPATVNGVLSANISYVGIYGVLANVVGASANSINGIALNASTSAPATGPLLMAFLALVW